MNTIRVVGMLLLLMVPALAQGEESTTKANAPERTPSTKTDSEGNLSSVMKWVQRFDNRVGDEISKAAGKTASAIKETVTDNQPKSQSPSDGTP